eukprot:GGOE01047478.1.p2 GENE.GGOE01047478.1~~GGOE01047478.1.p2  ORF type:complete len:112 (+),score=8.98 GGOE01047478.1:355-690(+)
MLCCGQAAGRPEPHLHLWGSRRRCLATGPVPCPTAERAEDADQNFQRRNHFTFFWALFISVSRTAASPSIRAIVSRCWMSIRAVRSAASWLCSAIACVPPTDLQVRLVMLW